MPTGKLVRQVFALSRRIHRGDIVQRYGRHALSRWLVTIPFEQYARSGRGGWDIRGSAAGDRQLDAHGTKPAGETRRTRRNAPD
jgi:hypothetical protein